MKITKSAVLTAVILLASSFIFSSCKSCGKDNNLVGRYESEPLVKIKYFNPQSKIKYFEYFNSQPKIKYVEPQAKIEYKYKWLTESFEETGTKFWNIKNKERADIFTGEAKKAKEGADKAEEEAKKARIVNLKEALEAYNTNKLKKALEAYEKSKSNKT